MAHKVSSFFSEEDLQRIKAAVQEAELKTSGEIVPYVVDRSGEYEEAQWKGAAMTSALILALFVLYHASSFWWIPLTYAQMASVVLVMGFAAFFFVKWNPAAQRLLAGHRLIERRVGQRAAEAFVSEEVFQTKERTGILLFLSLVEHRVLVMGDSGINAKVKQEEWTGIVERIVAGIRSGKPADGLIDGIRRCGELLQQHGVARRSDDKDELPDSLRMSDR
ncbi:MAG: TPM domain-containing protein [Bacteroidota bacterium]